MQERAARVDVRHEGLPVDLGVEGRKVFRQRVFRGGNDGGGGQIDLQRTNHMLLETLDRQR